jgi:hypothetical protein
MRKIIPAPEDEDIVRLKPILGLRPGIYLGALYGLAILAVLFFLCLFPGLSRPGSVLIVNTRPQGAAIRVDGINRGSAPEKIFVEKGSHTLELVMPGFETQRLELEVPGRIALSLFFPRRLVVEETLMTGDPLGVLLVAAEDYAAWSFTGEAAAAYQIPLSLSEGVYRAAPSLKGEQREAARDIIPAAARFAVSQASLRDLGRAKMLLDNGGFAPSPLSLAQSAGDILSWLSASPGTAPWLASLLPAEAAARIKDSPWFAQAGSSGGTPAVAAGGQAGVPARPALPASLQAAGLLFYRVSADTDFYYGETPVSAGAWETFVRARPEWGADNSSRLREQNLVNSDYLITPGDGQIKAEDPRTAVSWHAARAFCQWLGEQLPPGFETWEVRLPAEAEWEHAAAVFSPESKGSSRLWEWCLDPYTSLPSFSAAPWAVEALSSPEQVLRGGTRGSLPPNFCSPFVGFRPFIALRATGGGRRNK